MNKTINRKRNMTQGRDFPFITEYAGFSSDTYYINLQWNLENLFVNTYNRTPLDVNAYPVDGDLVIIADDLQPFDHYHLKRADNYNEYVMPNGQLLIDYYSSFVVDINDYMDRLDNAGSRGNVTRRTSDNLIDPVEVRVNPNFNKMYVGIRCYDENGEPVIASSGSVQISIVSAAGGIQHEAENGSLDASSPSPVLPIEIPVERLVASPEGLGGVTSWQLIVWQL